MLSISKLFVLHVQSRAIGGVALRLHPRADLCETAVAGRLGKLSMASGVGPCVIAVTVLCLATWQDGVPEQARSQP